MTATEPHAFVHSYFPSTNSFPAINWNVYTPIYIALAFYGFAGFFGGVVNFGTGMFFSALPILTKITSANIYIYIYVCYLRLAPPSLLTV